MSLNGEVGLLLSLMGLGSTEAFRRDHGKGFVPKWSFMKGNYEIKELCFPSVGGACVEVTKWSMSPQECAKRHFRTEMCSITYGNKRKRSTRKGSAYKYYALKVCATKYENSGLIAHTYYKEIL